MNLNLSVTAAVVGLLVTEKLDFMCAVCFTLISQLNGTWTNFVLLTIGFLVRKVEHSPGGNTDILLQQPSKRSPIHWVHHHSILIGKQAEYTHCVSRSKRPFNRPNIACLQIRRINSTWSKLDEPLIGKKWAFGQRLCSQEKTFEQITLACSLNNIRLSMIRPRFKTAGEYGISTPFNKTFKQTAFRSNDYR